MLKTTSSLMIAALMTQNAWAKHHHHHHAQNTQDQSIISTLTWNSKHDQSLPQSFHRIPRRSLVCIALNVYHEARGVSDLEKTYIAHVTLNRIKTMQWGHGACNTVYSTHPMIGRPGYGFSWVIQNINHMPKDEKSWEKSEKITLKSLSEPDPLKGATYYARRELHPAWAKNMITLNTPHTIHKFYKDNSPIEVAEAQ